MDFDITHLLPNIVDARRNGDVANFAHLVLRYLADFDLAVAYAPEGITKCLKDITESSKSAIDRSLRALQERKIILKLDEFSLQINGQFSRKSAKPLKYEGSRIIYSSSEQEFIFALQTTRAELWALRGKNKRRVKASGEGEETMNQLIVTLTRQLEAKDQQMEAKDQQIKALLKIISGGDEAKKAEISEKLALVIPIRK
jgi:hypothetical protein